jgi:disulfide bond formation protein DsbB
MNPLVATVTYIMSVGTVLLHFALIVFIAVTLFSPRLREWLHERIGSHGVMVSLAIVAASLVGSLFYSMVAGFSACLLCWIVRAMLYPQLVPLVAYLHRPRRWMLVVSLVMSSLATLASAYQVLLQFSNTVSTLCASVPGLGDCQVEYFRIWGYINIATMSLVASAALVVCQAVALHRKHWLKQD